MTEGHGTPNRRDVLKAGAALGLGAAGGLVGTTLSRRTDHTVEIVYALTRSRGPREGVTRRTKTVPADWHATLTQAFEARAQLADVGLSSYLSSFVVPGSFDEPQASVSIATTDPAVPDAVGRILPDFPVETTVLDDIPGGWWDDRPPGEGYKIPDLNPSRVPSGIACTSGDMTGTLGPALYDRNRDSRYFTTSNHLFGAKGAKRTAHVGEPLFIFQDGGPEVVGRVARGYPWADVVRVEPTGGYAPASKIATVSPGTVVGQFTKVGLADLMAREERLRKFGAFSRSTTGQIKGIDGITCYAGKVCKQGQLKWGSEQTMTDGDSGSVSYHPDPENPDAHLLVAGINNARTWWPGMDFTWGTAAYHLREQYGLQF